MRTTRDRIRHAIAFEVIGLVAVVPLGAWVFRVEMHALGVVAIVAAILAMAWNYIYNLTFDRLMQRSLGHTIKTFRLRAVHAMLFELGLLTVLLPFIAWYMQIGLWVALLMDLGLSGFFLIYAFVFNWSYDLLFPVPQSSGAG